MRHATTWSGASGGWSGDLKDIALALWSEPGSSDAAIVVAAGGRARCWINLHHADTPTLRLLAWMWCRHAAVWRPPVDVLSASDLDVIREPARQEA